MLAIQALRSIGKGNTANKEIEHIKMVLQNENPSHLKHDLFLAPIWIRELLIDNENKQNG